MRRSDYIDIIMDNILVYKLNLPVRLQGNKLRELLSKFDDTSLNVIAGFNKLVLKEFLNLSLIEEEKNLKSILKKFEKFSELISPMGNLSYLADSQIEYVLSKAKDMKLNDINVNQISTIADEQLQKEFGSPQYSTDQALENQISSAIFYLRTMGYDEKEISEKVEEVRKTPEKLDDLFNIPKKEIISVSSEVSPMQESPRGISASETDLESPSINDYIDQIEHEHPPERAQQVKEIIEKLKDGLKDEFSEQYERVYAQMHPDRLNRIYKIVRETKRKSKRMSLLLAWFFYSHLIENIEFKVEHWQVSSRAGHGNTGVYTAGISFSRYDNIIKEFPNDKLQKVTRIQERILKTPSKKAIQKLGQDLVSETGFDEHLYFTE